MQYAARELDVVEVGALPGEDEVAVLAAYGPADE
jgi:hypothetical protein